jgi:hypothetical protein
VEQRVLTIDYEGQHDLPAQAPLTLAFLADIQYGATGCDLNKLEKYIERAVAFEHVHYLGVGDFVDRMSPSNRTGIALARIGTPLYDSTIKMLDKAGREDIEAIKQILAPTRGLCPVCGNNNWLGIHEGHHFHPFYDGTTTDTRIADWLGCPMLGHTAATFLDFVDAHKHKGTFRIMSRHGEGGAQSESTVIRKLEALATDFVADLYVTGHYHMRFAFDRPRIDWVDTTRHHTMIDRTYYMVSAGSYLRGYVLGSELEGRPQGTYVERKGLRPRALGGIFIEVRPYRNGNSSGRLLFRQTPVYP